jgi:hypothetical protein
MPIYYIYAYIRKSNGTPYYIGKGTGKRAYKNHSNVNKPKNKNQIIILESNLTEIGAWSLERRLIKWWGKKVDNTGILHNKSDGGEGFAPFPRTSDHKIKISNTLKSKNRKTVITGGGTSGRIWINNHVQQKCILSEQSIPAGWFKGRLVGKRGGDPSLFN